MIPMYDELIEELRQHHCDAKEDDTQEVCEECVYDVIIADKSAPSGIASVCVCGLMNRAADAIEELQKQLREEKVDNVNLTGWLAEEHAKHLWIPVTERLPEDNGKYLTVFTVNTIPPRPVIEVSCYAKDLYKIDKYDFQDKKKKSGFYQYDSEWGYFEMSDISHWMPLPQPPESEDE